MSFEHCLSLQLPNVNDKYGGYASEAPGDMQMKTTSVDVL